MNKVKNLTIIRRKLILFAGGYSVTGISPPKGLSRFQIFRAGPLKPNSVGGWAADALLGWETRDGNRFKPRRQRERNSPGILLVAARCPHTSRRPARNGRTLRD